MRSKKLLPLTDLRAALEQLQAVDDAELSILKGHLVVERMLIHVAAQRMAIEDHELPDLNYAKLAALAFCGAADLDPIRERVFALNSLRNAIAHEFVFTSDSSQLRRFLELSTTDDVADVPLAVASSIIILGLEVLLAVARFHSEETRAISEQVHASIDKLRRDLRAVRTRPS